MTREFFGTTIGEPESDWHPAKFDLEGIGPFEGWSRDYHWNGWACPHFTAAQAACVIRQMQDEGIARFRVSDGLILMRDSDGEGGFEEEVQVRSFDHPELGRLFSIGGWNWIWSEVD